MIVFVAAYPGDIRDAEEVCAMARACSGSHDVRLVARDDLGNVPALGRSVSVEGWPRSCTQMFKAFVASLPVGSVFLNLEPDAVLTRLSSLDELQEASDEMARRWSSHCVLGHWKTPPLCADAPHEHVSGSAVYRVTETFKAAAESIYEGRPWDLDLMFHKRLMPHHASDTPLIRCLWRQRLLPRSIEENPKCALIHGDKMGRLRRYLMSTVFASAAP